MTTTSFRKQCSILGLTPTALAVAVGLFFWQGAVPISAQTIVDEWAMVQAPKPPELKPVTLEPQGTALLVLDFIPSDLQCPTAASNFGAQGSRFVETGERQRSSRHL
jgi:hypothetical protein